MPVPETVSQPRPIAVAVRRTIARQSAARARAHLLEAAKRLDDDKHRTAHENTMAAITACDDVVDAIDGHIEAERQAREDAARFRRDDELAKADWS